MWRMPLDDWLTRLMRCSCICTCTCICCVVHAAPLGIASAAARHVVQGRRSQGDRKSMCMRNLHRAHQVNCEMHQANQAAARGATGSE